MERLRKTLLTGRGRWITFGAAAVLLIILVMQFVPYLLSPPKTGDPLYDRMQHEIRRTMRNGPTAEPLMFGFHYWRNAPSPKVIESWEAEFQERSDYWMLLALCRRAHGGTELNRALMEKADACSDARPAVSAWLMTQELREVRLNDAGRNSWEEDTATEDIVERYRDRYPDSAWVCYLAASHYSYYGMDARYVGMLELGNSLGNADPGVPFPACVVVEGLIEGSSVGDELVAGDVLQVNAMEAGYAFSGMIHRKDEFKDMMVAGTELGFERGLNALVQSDLRNRSALALPVLFAAPTASMLMAAEVVDNNTAWPAGSPQHEGAQTWLADIEKVKRHLVGIGSRVEAVDPDLYARMFESPQLNMQIDSNGNLQQGKGQSDAGGLLNSLLDRINPDRVWRRAACNEFDYTEYLIEHEIPRSQQMFSHLATFDFEHPEEYVAYGAME